MYRNPTTPEEDAKAVAKFLAALGLDYDAMALVASNPQAKRAARVAMAAVINPPSVFLLKQVVGRDHYPSLSELYAVATELDFNWILGTSLSAEERAVVEYRCGFTTGHLETLETTAAAFNRTREWVKKILTPAFEKLKLVL